MPKFKLQIEVEIEAPTVREALRQFLMQPVRFAKMKATAADMPQGGLPDLPVMLDEWTDRDRAKALGYQVISSGRQADAWYVGHGPAFSAVTDDWHMSEEAAWLAAIRHAKRNWPQNWAVLG